MSVAKEKNEEYVFSAEDFDLLTVTCHVFLDHFQKKDQPPTQVTAYFYGGSALKHGVLVSRTENISVYPCSKNLSLLHHRKTHAPWLMFNVFAKYKDTDKESWECVHLVGTCKTHLRDVHENMTLSILSERGITLGTLNITQIKGQLPKHLEDDDDNITNARKEAAILLEKGHKKKIKWHPLFQGEKEYRPQLKEVTFRNEKWPMAVLVAAILNESKVQQDPDRVVSLFTWWLELAKSNVGIPSQRHVKECTVPEMRELLAEMFTMATKGLYYSKDQIKISDSTFKLEEQWTPLSMFPDLAEAAFDCEDGSLLVLQFLTCFRKHKFDITEQNELLYLQFYLRDYVSCFAVGQLRHTGGNEEGPDFVLHAYPLLLDRHHFQAEKKNETIKKPAILLETTNYISTTFTPSQNKDEKERDDFDAADVTLFVSNDNKKKNEKEEEDEDEHWRLVAHMKAPVGTVVQQRIFGCLHSVFVLHNDDDEEEDGNDDTCLVHYYVLTPKGGELGVPLMDVLTTTGQTDKMTFEEVTRVTETTLNTLHGFICQLPPFSLPPETELGYLPPEPLNSPLHWRIIVKYVNEDMMFHVVDRLKHTGHKIQQSTTLELFGNCFVQIIDIDKQNILLL